MSLKRTLRPGGTVQSKNAGVQVLNSIISTPTKTSPLAPPKNTVLTNMPSIPSNGAISTASAKNVVEIHPIILKKSINNKNLTIGSVNQWNILTNSNFSKRLLPTSMNLSY